VGSASVGRVETRRAVLFTPNAPLRLDSGAALAPVEVAYETYGRLDARRANAVVICHALTGDAHAAGHHGDPDRPGWWDNFIGPGKPVDTDRFFVICANLLGGCQGTTGPSSIDPSTGRPYGLRFPLFTVSDLVRVHRALVRHLGIERPLAAGEIMRVAPGVRRRVLNLGPELVSVLAIGGANPHEGRDGRAYRDWSDTDPRTPQEIPLPEDLPASELRDL
jgi:hypothetical protein